MLRIRFILPAGFLFLSGTAVLGQPPSPPPFEVQIGAVSNERRQMALLRILEGQRFLGQSYKTRSPAEMGVAVGIARTAFLQAIEYDPSIAEAYTALAEIAVSSPPNDIDEGIKYAAAAIKVDSENFGGRRLLARLYTLRSGINEGKVEPVSGGRAIENWIYVTKLDPRNAEAWAFLSALYSRRKETEKEIDALRKWIASAAPVETQFYQVVLGRTESLTADAASLKLGSALVRAGKIGEAVSVLSILVVDEPENLEAIDLLREAISSADVGDAAKAVESLRQAVFAKPESVALVEMLIEILERSGRTEEAEVLLKRSIEAVPNDKLQVASSLLSTLGDLYRRMDRPGDASAAFERALTTLGSLNAAVEPDGREARMRLFAKLLQVANQRRDDAAAMSVVERVRSLNGKDDQTADRMLIGHYRSSGKRNEALGVIRARRQKNARDESLRRLEASVLAELGKTGEAVAVMRARSTEPRSSAAGGVGPNDQMAYDAFSDLIFIASLYSDAGRGKDAASTAREAYAAAGSSERQQIANLTLASALQQSGDYIGAEITLLKLLTQMPGNPIALNNLGYFLVERNERLDEAIAMIKQALKVDPTNPSYLDSLGWAYFKTGKPSEAELQLRRALRFDPDSVAINEHLGDVLHKSGKAAEAKSYWRRALELATKETDIIRLRGKIE
ncbi:MAG: tetratricopeptide repeat protein [Pyrinomonadaceae bacterium]|nr:tetratricopeptide repeat protein [Pyrinomonadaceae bacterium]MBP6213538.1 tetratricopeptide repeat protein [Pyrinomonadaceae bacterium]